MNSEHEYKTDASGYGVGELWAIMGPGDTGDCEDFALTKMQALIDAGYDVANLQIAVGKTETGGNHAFLVIQTANRGTLVLDNRFDQVMKIENVPYQFEAYQKAGQTWAGYATKLVAVSIEYMGCNAKAFADGDQVIVEFTGQDWNSPKVIGFKSNPVACSGTVFIFYSEYFGGGGAGHVLTGYEHNFELGTYVKGTELTSKYITYYGMGAGRPGERKAHYFGGVVPAIVSPPEQRGLFKNYNIEYDLDLQTFSDKENMSIARGLGSAFELSGLYVVAGATTGEIYLDNLDKYDHVADSWEAKQNHVYELWYFDTFVLSEKGYTIGGLNGSQIGGSNITNKNVEYDPTGDAWALKTNLPADEWYGSSCFADHDSGKGYITGGYTNPAFDAFSRQEAASLWRTQRCYEYDPVTDTYDRKTDYLNNGYQYFPGSGEITANPSEDYEGDGPYLIWGAGNYGSGTIYQHSIWHDPYYNMVPTQNYESVTDSWQQQSYLPDGIIFTLGTIVPCEIR